MNDVATRLRSVRSAISEECSRLGRIEPVLIVVTKNHPVSLVENLYNLGVREFGENRIQEASGKFKEFESSNPGNAGQWHLIGQLQTNKVKQALEFAHSVHSLDRQSLLEELSKRTAGRSSPLEVFIQINLTDDPERGGVNPENLLAFSEQVVNCPTLQLSGVMAVAGLNEEPSSEFEKVARLSEMLVSEHPAATGRSIGMSGDYMEALAFGATHLRIGSAITGNRII